MTSLQNIKGSLFRYFRLFLWLLKDALLPCWLRSSWILGIGFLGVTLQISALAQAIYYAKLMKKGNEFTFANYSVDPRTSLLLLLLLSVGVLISLLSSAFMIYYSESRLISFCRNYEDKCSIRILSALSNASSFNNPETGNFYQTGEVMKLCSTVSRFCGRSLRKVLENVIPFITFIIAYGVLLYTDALTTLFLSMLFLFFIPLLWKVNVKGALNTLHYEDHGKTAKKVIKDLVIQLTSGSSSSQNLSYLEEISKTGSIADYRTAYERRINLPNRSHLVNHILTATGITVLLLFVGSNMIINGIGWEHLVVYLLALRYCLKNLQKVSASVAICSRFYPITNRYYYFMSSLNPDSPPVAMDRTEFIIHPGSSDLEGSLDRFRIRPGKKIDLICSLHLNSLSLFTIMNTLLNKENSIYPIIDKTCFITDKYTPPPVALSTLFEQEQFQEELKEIIGPTSLWPLFREQMPLDSGIVINPEKWAQADKKLKYLIGFMVAIKSNPLFLVIDASVLYKLPDSAQKYFLEKLKSTILIIIHKEDDYISENSDIFVCMDENEITGIGDYSWMRKNKVRISEIFEKAKNEEITTSFQDDNDEDDEI